jgi:hypothetical protein
MGLNAESVLLTDLYQLTMLQAYYDQDMNDTAGLLAGDTLMLEGDPQPGLPLLEPVMAAGRRLAPAPSLAEIRERLVAQLAGLSPAQRALAPTPPYSVKVCPALHDLAWQVDQRRLAPVTAEQTLSTAHPGS